MEAEKSEKVKVKIADDLGELNLGKLDKECFNDPDLRDLLNKTDLDANKMFALGDQKLRLVYSVIYSERLEYERKVFI